MPVQKMPLKAKGLLTEMINKVYILLLLFITGTFSVNEMYAEKYQGPVKESDIRIRDVLKILISEAEAKQNPPPAGTPAAEVPQEFILRYSRMHNRIYLVFYDIEGREIFFQFRDIRWDDRGDRILKKMISGDVYRVRGRHSGIFLRERFYSKDSESYPDYLRDPDSVPVYRFGSAEQTIQEFIKF